jgi:cytochrome P450
MLGATASISLQVRVLLSRRMGDRRDPLAKLNVMLSAVDEVLMAEIAERRADPDATAQRDDVLSMLASVEFDDGSRMDERELRDQLMTLLLAGHETTATALAWAFDLLLRHPEALDRLTAEVRAGEDDRYMRAVISEALRLRPVVPLAGRRLAADLDAGGLHLPAGTDITPAIWLTHTREDVYPDPLAFRPERFLDDGPETYGWVPFGGGVRRCLGAAFAEFEMRVVLSEVLRTAHLNPVGTKPERVARRNITLAPEHGTPVVLSA